MRPLRRLECESLPEHTDRKMAMASRHRNVGFQKSLRAHRDAPLPVRTDVLGGNRFISWIRIASARTSLRGTLFRASSREYGIPGLGRWRHSSSLRGGPSQRSVAQNDIQRYASIAW